MATSERTTRSGIFDHCYTHTTAAAAAPFPSHTDPDSGSDSDCMHSLQRLRHSLANMGFDTPTGSPGPLDGRGSSTVNRPHPPRRPRTAATLHAVRDSQTSSRSSSSSSSSSVTEAAPHTLPPHPARPRAGSRHEATADAEAAAAAAAPQPSASRRRQKDEEKLSALLSKPSTPASLVKALRAHCKAAEAKVGRGGGSGFDPSVALLRASATLLTKMERELVGLRRRQAAADTSAEAAAAAAAAPVPTPSLRGAAKGEEARVAVDLALRENAALRATMDASAARMQAALDRSRREVACLKEEKAALEEAWQLRQEDEERMSRHKAPFEPNYVAGEDGMPLLSTRRALHHHRSAASPSTAGGGGGGAGSLEARSPRTVERVVEDKLQRMRLLGCLTKKGPLTYVTPKKKTMRLCAPPPSGVVRVRVGGGTMPLEEFMEEKGAQYFGLLDDASAVSTGTSSPHLQGLLRTPR